MTGNADANTGMAEDATYPAVLNMTWRRLAGTTGGILSTRDGVHGTHMYLASLTRAEQDAWLRVNSWAEYIARFFLKWDGPSNRPPLKEQRTRKPRVAKEVPAVQQETQEQRDLYALHMSFIASVEAAGATASNQFKDVTRRRGYQVVCASGHSVWMKPYRIEGAWICPTCVKVEAAERLLERLRPTLPEGVSIERRQFHVYVTCAQGHGSYNHTPEARAGYPDGLSGYVCMTCEFDQHWKAVGELATRSGFKVLGPRTFKDTGFVSLPIACPEGHESWFNSTSNPPRCPECPRPEAPVHNAYYVVSGLDRETGLDTVKPGISSDVWSNRLKQHRADGLTTRHMLVTGLPEGVARGAELFVLDQLKGEGGWKNTRGDEYFPLAALTDALATAQHYMANELIMTKQCHSHPRHEAWLAQQEA